MPAPINTHRRPSRPSRPLLIAALICLACVITPARAADFVRANGTSFELCHQPFRFVGFNVRGICHYGKGDALPFSSTADIATNLDYCVAAGVTVIRVFCAYRNIGPVETGNRLQTVLDAAYSRGIRVLVALTDNYVNSNMFPQGDEVYYTRPGCCGLTLLNHQFYAGGYQDNYLPQALYLADRFKNHPGIFAWQLGNEIRNDGGGTTFMAFCHDVAAQIRAVDPNHMISIGVIDSVYAGVNGQTLYAPFDFVSTHNYNGGGRDDSALANALNKPYMIGEAGFDSTVFGPDRTGHVHNDLNKWINTRGARGYLQWGLMAGPHDNGDGDVFFGVDRVFHEPDFLAYRDLFNTWGQNFAQPPALVVAPEVLETTVAISQNAPPANFTVAVTGGTPANFSISESIAWLTLSPTGGQAGCAAVPINITYDTSWLPPGTHLGQIQVSAAGIPDSPATVTVSVTVEGLPGDFDGDGDVDMDDFGAFQVCLSGPGIPQTDPACAPARFDTDLDVDQNDLAGFLNCMSGAHIPADPDCASSP